MLFSHGLFKKIGVLSLLTTLCSPVLSAPTAGVSVPDSLKNKQLTFTSFGGYYQESQIAALQDFANTTKVKLKSDGPVVVAKIQAQVESGKVYWDVVDVGDNVPSAFCGKLFMKLDFSKIDTSHLPEGQIGECSVPAMNFGILFMYNNAKYGANPPQNWDDFFNVKKFPGVRTLIGDSAVETSFLERAMIQAGADPNNLTVQDIDKGFELLRSMREHIIFWQTGAQSQQMLESGEVDMIVVWTGRGMHAVRNGAKYTPVWNDWLIVMDQLAIPIGAKDPDASHALINAYLGKRAQEIMTEKSGYSPVNNQANPQIDTIAQAWITTTPEKMAMGYRQHLDFWATHYKLANEKWAEFMTGY